MGDCGGSIDLQCRNKHEAVRLKGGAILGILVASSLGVTLPLVGRKLKALRADSNPFLVIKAFAAGVILATGFVHVLGDAAERLGSDCLPDMPWHKFPWTGFISMMAVFLTLTVDALGTQFYERKLGVSGHSHGVAALEAAGSRVATEGDLEHHHDTGHKSALAANCEAVERNMRHVVISQVLEVGIITHSVIIGISLGVSDSPCSIRPLFAALVFHQFFEGLALGGCIAQAGFKKAVAIMMACFFAATTPFGIAVGIGISSSYNENSQTSLIVQGVFDAVSSGILIYMALVDLIAHDFLGNRMRSDQKLQIMCYISLIIGALAMSAIAIWA